MNLSAVQARPADVAAGMSLLGYLGSKLIEATPLLQALALIVTIIAGAASVFYHWTHRKQKHKGPPNRRASDEG